MRFHRFYLMIWARRVWQVRNNWSGIQTLRFSTVNLLWTFSWLQVHKSPSEWTFALWKPVRICSVEILRPFLLTIPFLGRHSGGLWGWRNDSGKKIWKYDWNLIHDCHECSWPRLINGVITAFWGLRIGVRGYGRNQVGGRFLSWEVRHRMVYVAFAVY